jgi:hypothetical protein
VSVNRALKLASRPGETAEQFVQRCTTAADAAADREADALRARLEPRVARLKDQIAEAQQRADHARSEASSRRTSDVVSAAGGVLGALFGGRRGVRSIATAASRVAGGTARSQQAGNRAEQALARVETRTGDLQELEDQLAADLTDIVAKWDGIAAEVETVEVPLEKGDVSVTAVTLVWIPTAAP